MYISLGTLKGLSSRDWCMFLSFLLTVTCCGCVILGCQIVSTFIPFIVHATLATLVSKGLASSRLQTEILWYQIVGTLVSWRERSNICCRIDAYLVSLITLNQFRPWFLAPRCWARLLNGSQLMSHQHLLIYVYNSYPRVWRSMFIGSPKYKSFI